MNGLRTTRTVLLSVALLFGILGLILPLAHSVVTYGGAEVEETYTLWGVERTIDGHSTANPHGPLDQGWTEGGLDGTGGITYLRAAIPLVVIGVVLAAVALLLTVIPATGENRSGGIVSAAGLVAIFVGFVLHGWGLVLRNSEVFSAWIPESVVGAYLLVLAAFLLLGAALAGMTHERTVQQTTRDGVTVTSGHGDHASLRYFQCNGCGNVESVHDGDAPVCDSCGNASPI